MENENLELDVEDEVSLAKEFAEYKRNSKSLEEYNKVKKEKEEIIRAFASGEALALEDQKPVDVNEIRMRFTKAESSLDGISAALELRDAIIAKGGKDPFLPVGKKISPTDEDIATANRVAEGFRHCIEYAEGDPHIFANELSRITVDNGFNPRRRKR